MGSDATCWRLSSCPGKVYGGVAVLGDVTAAGSEWAGRMQHINLEIHIGLLLVIFGVFTLNMLFWFVSFSRAVVDSHPYRHKSPFRIHVRAVAHHSTTLC